MYTEFFYCLFLTTTVILAYYNLSGSQKGRELPERKNEAHRTSINEAQSEDDEDYEGQPSGYMYL